MCSAYRGLCSVIDTYAVCREDYYVVMALCTNYRPIVQDSRVIGMQCVHSAVKLYHFARIADLWLWYYRYVMRAEGKVWLQLHGPLYTFHIHNSPEACKCVQSAIAAQLYACITGLFGAYFIQCGCDVRHNLKKDHQLKLCFCKANLYSKSIMWPLYNRFVLVLSYHVISPNIKIQTSVAFSIKTSTLKDVIQIKDH